MADIHYNDRVGRLLLELKRRGIESLHNGGRMNNWSDGAVKAVIQKMNQEHGFSWSKQAAKEHLTKKARVYEFDDLESYYERMVATAEREERSRQFDAVIQHPAAAECLRNGGELHDEGLPPWRIVQARLKAEGVA